MSQERHPVFQAVAANQGLQLLSLRAFAGDGTLELRVRGVQLGAGTYEECVILHRVQTPH